MESRNYQIDHKVTGKANEIVAVEFPKLEDGYYFQSKRMVVFPDNVRVGPTRIGNREQRWGTLYSDGRTEKWCPATELRPDRPKCETAETFDLWSSNESFIVLIACKEDCTVHIILNGKMSLPSTTEENHKTDRDGV
jgi:hypothetical protein